MHFFYFLHQYFDTRWQR